MTTGVHILDLLGNQDDPRYEIKIGVPRTSRAAIDTWLHDEGLGTAYPPRVVRSVYFDTPDFTCLESAEAGIADRVKARIRWYGEGLSPDELRFEAKCKRAQAGFKHIAKLRGPIDFESLSWRAIRRLIRPQLPPVLGLLFDTTERPSVAVRYYREYFVTRDGAIRVTIDNELTLWPQHLLRPQFRRSVILDPMHVAEIKAAVPDRQKVAQMISSAPGRPTRLSKYALALQASRT